MTNPNLIEMPLARTVGMLSDEEVVRRVLEGETALFEVIMRRYNERLYRAARAITRDDSLAEEIMQSAYVRAYEHLDQFAGRAPFGAWLTRIAVNEALARVRDSHRFSETEGEGDPMDRFASPSRDPEQTAANTELASLLERLIEALPDGIRSVFVLREVEGMNTTETAESLDISEESVRVRLHRARASLRDSLAAHAIRGQRRLFAFHAPRCDRVVRNVLDQITANPISR
ncbi:MAG TPA: RNA polymerase sigma factor [Acidobacteriaceae bacterium]|nr:RNA polymerase sigma factor [Acidobacteriaceae bacterium]